MDKVNKKIRSEIMRRVKGKDTNPEMIVRRFLYSRGIRFRTHQKELPGCPDIIIRKYMTVIFVNGCFWHGHEGCSSFRMPKSSMKYWNEKIKRNKDRDIKNLKILQQQGWNVFVVWECQLKNKNKEEILNNILKELKKQ